MEIRIGEARNSAMVSPRLYVIGL